MIGTQNDNNQQFELLLCAKENYLHSKIKALSERTKLMILHRALLMAKTIHVSLEKKWEKFRKLEKPINEAVSEESFYFFVKSLSCGY